jgi:hypothetical protein
VSRTSPLPRIDGKGIIDMHIHVGPELLRRRYSPASLAEEARREGIGVVMKNHFIATTGWVSQLRRPDDAVPLVGSVVLNSACGGIDTHGIRAAFSGWKRDVSATDPDAERFVVWMPTLCAEAHLNLYGRQDIPLAWGIREDLARHFAEGEGLRITRPDGSLIPTLAAVLAMIAEHDLVLASGHLDRAETKRLALEAQAAGVRRLVLTHPLYQATQLSPDELRDLWREHGAYSELCFVNMAMDHLSIGAYADVIRTVGPEGCILSSDVGQTFSPPLAEAMRTFFDMLRGEGIADDDIARMSVTNPHKLLFG